MGSRIFCFRSLATLSLCLALTAPALATHPARSSAVFQVLHGRASSGGMRAEGLEFSFAEGQLSLRADRLWLDPQTRLEGVTMSAPLEVDEAFFAAPVSGMVAALLAHTDLQATRFASERSSLFSLSNLQMQLREGHLTMEGHRVARIRAEGDASWIPDEQRLAITLTKLRAGPLPIPQRVAFRVMADLLRAPFIELSRPRIFVSLADFLR